MRLCLYFSRAVNPTAQLDFAQNNSICSWMCAGSSLLILRLVKCQIFASLSPHHIIRFELFHLLIQNVS